MARSFFEDVADALAGFLPRELRSYHVRWTGRNVKIWYGDEAREHYEVQLVSASAIAAVRRRGEVGAAGGRSARRSPALEVGFHAEHPNAAVNEAALERFRAHERTWRRSLGRDAEAGAFLGGASPWRRLSEVWDGAGVTGPEAAIEAAERLAAYIRALEPARRGA